MMRLQNICINKNKLNCSSKSSKCLQKVLVFNVQVITMKSYLKITTEKGI